MTGLEENVFLNGKIPAELSCYGLLFSPFSNRSQYQQQELHLPHIPASHSGNQNEVLTSKGNSIHRPLVQKEQTYRGNI